MAQNDASSLEKLAGLVAQTRSDVGAESLDQIRHVLGQRLEQTGIELPDHVVDELARQIHSGDPAAPATS
ncbi:hypothetical protein [Microbacterium hominis]|uniref:Uncharacterized protein n=1 Tax=Microbacterium hominis TaxID=162426 RepID=A0A7D4TLR5_9MICO|nr:hypothetical protein [Microbacterium hominis]QKJ18482.1 hypothetical protein HQM25_03150 [Microbacterium hominis]